MHYISVDDFKEQYCPILNNCTPCPNSVLKDSLGNVIWDKRDYGRIISYLMLKAIWTITQNDSNYYITAGCKNDMSASLVGYIVTEVPYTLQDISNLSFSISK